VASDAQYEYFKFLYEHERARYEALVNRGKLYLSIVTLYMGLLAVGTDKAIDALGRSMALRSVYMVSVLLLVTALVFVVYAVGIYTNEKPSDPEQLVSSFGDERPSDEAFRDARIVDLAVATGRNSANNDRRAKRLRTATILLLSGIFGQAIFLTLIVAS